MTSKSILTGFFSLTLLAVSAAAFAAPSEVDSLVSDLAAKPAKTDCEPKLPDGSCPDQPNTRQIVLGGKKVTVPVSTGPVHHVMRAITFGKGSADLTAGAKATLDAIAAALVQVSSYRPFTVEGHTDSKGARDLNQKLSQSRADAVVAYLAGKGVKRDLMTAKGFGPDKPLAGVDPANPRNRRVEVSAK